MTKWEGRPHWEYDGVYLGADEHGEWLGFRVGTFYRRPGMEFVATFSGVMLVPAGGAAHLAAFNDQAAKAAIYVDMATPAAWDGRVLRSVDLDLDVVKLQDGTVYVDDEDEFAEHTVEYGYPADVVAMAEASAREVFAAVRAGVTPYDGTAERWLRELQVSQGM
ncbi:hypothetical protein GCM10022242_02490 [Nocardioides panacisoli]|uniref:DUF402 domain-containing protein n=2 Tax=Nocardioides panacisoli TaxID=627624 RepID=A0ABP7I059_9ACTN